MTMTVSILLVMLAYFSGCTTAERTNFDKVVMSFILIILVVLITVAVHRGGLS